jgi:hypothetical protein
MNATIPSSCECTAQAVEELSVRWEKAIGILLAADTPQWKRTRQAIWCFQGLPLHNLPRKGYRRIDTCFARINHVLAGYTIRTEDDYQRVSTEDLTKIAKLLYDIV